MSISVEELDDLCGRFYNNAELPVRMEAQSRLEQMTAHDSNLDGSVYTTILQQSNSQYSLLFCSQSIVLWFKANEKRFSEDTKGEIVLTIVRAVRRLKQGNAPRHAVNAVVTAAAKVSKLGTEKEPLLLHGIQEALRMVQADLGTTTSGGVGDASAMNSNSQEPPQPWGFQLGVGLQLLNAFVTEFNLYDSTKSQSYMNFATHRRCSNNFKDNILLTVFVCSLSCLEAIDPSVANQAATLQTAGAAGAASGASSGPAAFAAEIVALVKNCLTYDFMAIIVDETEDALSAQFPAAWKEVILSDRCLKALWQQHANLHYPHCAALLAGVSSICGIRRSFFDTAEEKVQFLDFSMTHICDVENVQDDRLKNPHYCSVMADCITKFVSPFGYKDLSSSPSFERWIRFAEKLTSGVFGCMFGQDGSFATTTTMMQFWGRICNSKRMYLGDDDQRRDLEEVVPALATAFFTSRITPWTNVDMDDELTESVLAQADAFPPLVLIDTRRTLEMLHQAMQQRGPAVLSTPSSLGWLLYLAGSIVRNVFQTVDESLSDPCSYFLLFAVECVNQRRTNANVAASGFHDFVEGAMLHFLSSVQLVFTSSRLSVAINRIITNVFEEKVKLFHFILYSIGHNITRDPTTTATAAGDARAIVRTSIDLIGDACRDVPASIMKELRMDLPPVVQLPMSQHVDTYKLRTNLTAAMWSLRSGTEATYQTGVLLQFLSPIEDLMRQTCEGNFRDSLFVAGWLRDLRGVARGTSNQQSSFTDFVDWVIDHAAYFTDILRASRPSPPSPLVISSLLRFLSELVTTSRYGKVNLPTSAHCASGIMLFKFLCQMLQDILAITITDEQLQQVSGGSIPDGVYRCLLKPLWLSMDIMRKCLHGDFVPFGAMQLYKDDSLDVTVLGMFRMLTVFPFPLFRQYAKTSFAVLDLLRSMTELQVVSPLACMGSDGLSHIIQFAIFMCSDVDTATGSLLHGLSFLSFIAQLVGTVKVMVTSPSMSPADLSNRSGGGALAAAAGGKGPRSSRRLREAIANTLAPHTDLWTTLIHTAMNVIVCQDRALSVCCSVVFPIFEADPGFWYQFVGEFVSTYPERKQQAIQAALSELANEGETQEKFFSQVFLFRNKMRAM